MTWLELRLTVSLDAVPVRQRRHLAVLLRVRDDLTLRLAEDVRYYGKWMRDEAEKRIGHLYPPVEITAEMAQERPDLKPLISQKLTVIAWLWARTVKSPNPAFSHVDVPLASTLFCRSWRLGVLAVQKVKL